MSLKAHVNPATVISIARWLQAAEPADFVMEHFADVQRVRHYLDESLSCYLEPNESVLNGWSPVEYLEHSLKVLLEAVKAMINYLTKTGEQKLSLALGLAIYEEAA